MNQYLLATALFIATPAIAASTEPPPSAVITSPSCDPVWPASSVANQESGTTEMTVLVKPDGRASDIKVTQSSGYRELDIASVRAAAKCTYAPKTVDGVRSEEWKQLKFKWEPGKEKARAEYYVCAKPEWPKEALRNEYQGTVQLGFLIGTDGKVRDSRIEKSSGHAILDVTAQDALSRCQFKPPTKDGQPVESWFSMQYRWQLN
ncbi:TonB family C-terminal domain-containing protein [Duganella sp. CF402]|uniref:energy transducer TonB n=1 Tax=unclassified Duganella TaxID=2636909 RepID=UPI0008BD9C33|nr:MULTISPECIES: energy transducer TonB [unclassified Duganella]RZT09448.1 TonB family protein [Duganella sp. BK701]SEL56956.1 TonB family C-terminal domain-containing protein [Duganella sp. CF402]